MTWLETHIVVPAVMTCWHCGLDTHFAEPNFEAPLHPGVCTDAKWAEYDEANRRRDAEVGPAVSGPF